MRVGIRHVQTKQLEFYITPERVIVCTKLQTFSLEPQEYYWRKRMGNLGVAIALGEVETLEDLSRWLSVYDDAGVYIGQCIKLVPYKRAWVCTS